MAKVPKTKLSVLLEPSLAELFERYCQDRGLKKSTFAEKLIRDHLQEQGFSFQADLPPASHWNKKI